jgi:hypothetical protein
MQPNTLTRLEYKGKIYVKKIRKNSCRIRNRIRIRIQNQLKIRIRIRIRKNHSGSTTLDVRWFLTFFCSFHLSRTEIKDLKFFVMVVQYRINTFFAVWLILHYILGEHSFFSVFILRQFIFCDWIFSKYCPFKVVGPCRKVNFFLRILYYFCVFFIIYPYLEKTRMYLRVYGENVKSV